MSVGRVSLVRGYVLHQRAWRDTSLQIEAFTPDAGRVGLIARGARRAGSRTRPLLEPFQPLLLSWSGRGELHTLTGVESAGWRAPPNGPALLGGFYCSELVLRLLVREDPNPEAFEAYDRAVTALAGQSENAEAPLRRFELELLGAIGYGPPLEVDTETGEPVRAEREYDYLPERGPVAATGPVGEDTVRVPGADLLALCAGQLDDPGTLRSARRVLRSALRPLLGPRPLKSREMYRAMYGGGGGSR